MKIDFLKRMKDNPKISENYPMRGLSLEKIKDIEKKINNGKPFPKAFKEFLFLGGGYSDLGIGPGYDIDWDLEDGEDYIEQMKVYKGIMNKRGLKLDHPFIIFNPDADSSFDFIYLDQEEDPRPMICYLDPRMIASEGQVVPFPQKTFSELINDLVDRALNGLTPF